LLLLLGSDLSSGVGELDSDLLGALDDISSCLWLLMNYSGTDVVGNFTAEGSVIHEEDIEILGVVDEELLEAVGEEKLGCIV
jgi:hypothetical protein